MTWLVPLVIHALVWLIVVIDVVAAAMTPRERAAWLLCVAVLPGVGVAFYALLRRSRNGDNGPDRENEKR